ncbi:MAG: Lrp/AsnC ligand binding domain-containing protein [Candidatus Methanofastidiosia archaeon]
MSLAYILCVAESGKEWEIIKKLEKFKEVAETFIVYGEYDIIIKVEVPSTDALRIFMTEKVRNISFIERTTTLIAI